MDTEEVKTTCECGSPSCAECEAAGAEEPAVMGAGCYAPGLPPKLTLGAPGGYNIINPDGTTHQHNPGDLLARAELKAEQLARLNAAIKRVKRLNELQRERTARKVRNRKREKQAKASRKQNRGR